MTNSEKRAYSRGYTAGLRGRWPEWSPPNPPEPQVLALFVAAKDLRDAAFSVLQVIIPDEEIFLELQRQAEGVDAAFEAVSRWLKSEASLTQPSLTEPC